MEGQRGQGVDIVHLHYVKAGVRGGGPAGGLRVRMVCPASRGLRRMARLGCKGRDGAAGLDNAHYPNRRVERLPCPQ